MLYCSYSSVEFQSRNSPVHLSLPELLWILQSHQNHGLPNIATQQKNIRIDLRFGDETFVIEQHIP